LFAGAFLFSVFLAACTATTDGKAFFALTSSMSNFLTLVPLGTTVFFAVSGAELTFGSFKANSIAALSVNTTRFAQVGTFRDTDEHDVLPNAHATTIPVFRASLTLAVLCANTPL
jgi:hypothetical protein